MPGHLAGSVRINGCPVAPLGERMRRIWVTVGAMEVASTVVEMVRGTTPPPMMIVGEMVAAVVMVLVWGG